MMRYILYKLVNNILFNLKNSKIGPTLYKNSDFYSINYGNKIHFKTLHSTTHFGDRLFLLPIIINLKKHGINVSSDDPILNELYKNICGEKMDNNSDYIDYELILKPAYYDLVNPKIKQLYIDFTDTSTRYKISHQLNSELSKYFGINYENINLVNNKTKNIFNKNKIVIFSNYIDSGSFRKYFTESKKLNKKCIELKKNGYKIYHVGTNSDKNNDRTKYDFVDFDLRGQTSLEEIINYFKDNNDLIVVGYDNFLMHLGLIYNKKVFILFRGRFLNMNYKHHMNYVNSNFGTITEYL